MELAGGVVKQVQSAAVAELPAAMEPEVAVEVAVLDLLAGPARRPVRVGRNYRKRQPWLLPLGRISGIAYSFLFLPFNHLSILAAVCAIEVTLGVRKAARAAVQIVPYPAQSPILIKLASTDE